MSTYTPIASQTLTSAATSVTFNGLPQNYTDIVLVASFSSAVADNDVRCTVNGDTGSNYSYVRMSGNGTNATSGKATTTYIPSYFVIGTSTNPQIIIWNMMNYSNSTTYKTILSRISAADKELSAAVALWQNTAPITSVTFTNAGNNSPAQFASGSVFSLYGITSGSPKAFGGDVVTTDGTYWYHTFKSSGLFTPSTALTCDYLVVAGGGGGGGSAYAGGGGAGGYRTSIGGSQLSLTSQVYAVTVGAGGAGGTAGSGTQGGNSIFASITSTGGGGGGNGETNGNSGGSGGGAGGSASTNHTGGSGNSGGYSPVEGYAGGNAPANGSPPIAIAGGGGGSGAVGGTGGSSGGNGGNGTANSISGSSVTYAGGGGGGQYNGSGNTSGGTGGGGNGGNNGHYGTTSIDATSGTANLGGGGGGGGGSEYPPRTGNGGNGGSGIVIVRYAI